MPAGRPRQPTAIKKLRGNPGRRPLPENEPQMSVVLPPVPDSLSKIARDEWKRAAEILYNARVLTSADLAILRGYCVNFESAFLAEQIVNEEGITVTEYRGSGESQYTVLKEHPAHVAGLKARKQMLEFARELALTPASRTRVQSRPPPDEGAPLEKLRSRLRGIKGGKS